MKHNAGYDRSMLCGDYCELLWAYFLSVYYGMHCQFNLSGGNFSMQFLALFGPFSPCRTNPDPTQNNFCFPIMEGILCRIISISCRVRMVGTFNQEVPTILLNDQWCYSM